MCYIEQQINAYLRELDRQDEVEREQEQIGQFYFEQLADNASFANEFVDELINGEYFGDDFALEAHSLLKIFIQEVADPRANAEIEAVKKFKSNLELLCDKAAEQAVKTRHDVFGLIEKYSGF